MGITTITIYPPPRFCVQGVLNGSVGCGVSFLEIGQLGGPRIGPPRWRVRGIPHPLVFQVFRLGRQRGSQDGSQLGPYNHRALFWRLKLGPFLGGPSWPIISFEY